MGQDFSSYQSGTNNLTKRKEDGVSIYMIDPESDARAMEALIEVRNRGVLLLSKLTEMTIQNSSILHDFPGGTDRPIIKSVKRLLAQYGERGQDLTLHEFYTENKRSTVVAENVGKEKISICLRHRQDPTQINDVNTIFRVLMHEFAHTMDENYVSKRDHGAVFYRLQDFLFLIAKSIHIRYQDQQVPLYQCRNGPVPFCGLQLTARGCPNASNDSPNTNEEELPDP